MFNIYFILLNIKRVINMIECIINNMFCLLNLWKSIINSKNIINIRLSVKYQKMILIFNFIVYKKRSYFV